MRRNPWPYAIIAYFGVFITGVITLITFAARHDEQLVGADYYEQEIRFQKQIDRVTRTAPLSEKVEVSYNAAAETLQLNVPPEAGGAKASATIQLYRPSNEKLDRQLNHTLNKEGRHSFPVPNLEAGFWKVRLSWKGEGKEYYLDRPLIISR